QFEESLLLADLDLETRGTPQRQPLPMQLAEPLELEAEVYGALVLGVRDYVQKNHFKDVVLGLSGGVDSSLVATVAVDALGAQHVAGILMPSRYSSESSISDAEALARSLRIKTETVPIGPVFAALMQALEK